MMVWILTIIESKIFFFIIGYCMLLSEVYILPLAELYIRMKIAIFVFCMTSSHQKDTEMRCTNFVTY